MDNSIKWIKCVSRIVLNYHCQTDYIPTLFIIFLTYAARKVSVFGVSLVRIFSHLDRIQRDMEYLSAFSPNAGK